MSIVDEVVAMLLKVIFSFSMLMSEEGRCAIDLRGPGRVCAALGDCVIAILNLPQRAMSSNSRSFSFGKILSHVWLRAVTTVKNSASKHTAILVYIGPCIG